MMELQIFNSQKFGEIRAFQSEDGSPLFVDVARALGYEDPAKAIATHCKSSDTTKRIVAHKNGKEASDVRKDKGLPEKTNVRENMSLLELQSIANEPTNKKHY